jgi:hypothetical protein
MEISMIGIMLITLLTVILLYSVALLVFMIMDNIPNFQKLFDQWHQTELLRHHVYQYRLSSMLQYLGIPMEDYVTKLPVRAITQHIKRCRSCPNIQVCDRCLRDGEMTSNLDFCPNYSSLVGFGRIIS